MRQKFAKERANFVDSMGQFGGLFALMVVAMGRARGGASERASEKDTETYDAQETCRTHRDNRAPATSASRDTDGQINNRACLHSRGEVAQHRSSGLLLTARRHRCARCEQSDGGESSSSPASSLRRSDNDEGDDDATANSRERGSRRERETPTKDEEESERE
jgi:hypothetical protein